MHELQITMNFVWTLSNGKQRVQAEAVDYLDIICTCRGWLMRVLMFRSYRIFFSLRHTIRKIMLILSMSP